MLWTQFQMIGPLKQMLWMKEFFRDSSTTINLDTALSFISNQAIIWSKLAIKFRYFIKEMVCDVAGNWI